MNFNVLQIHIYYDYIEFLLEQFLLISVQHTYVRKIQKNIPKYLLNLHNLDFRGHYMFYLCNIKKDLSISSNKYNEI